jgi:stearoyl-CoA desaturase (delta-9 desaturase)
MEQNPKWQHQPRWNGEFSWVNTAFLIGTPALAAALLPLYLAQGNFSWADLAIFCFMTAASGFSITAGYHRLFAHQTYETHPLIRFLFLIFGAGAFQNSAFKWSSDHRYHHRFVDKEGDPYNINRGFFYAHMGWIFRHDPAARSFANADDLQIDPLVRWQHKYFLLI